MTGEVWNVIFASPGYEVSNKGNVRNRETGHIMTPRPTKTGYLRVHLPVQIGRKDFYIHRLVAESFCIQPDGCNVVNHIDNNNQNNSAENLEWTTPLGNVYHGMIQKRFRLNAVPVVGYKDGKWFCFISAHQAEYKTGCDHSSIIKCCKGKKHTVKGFTWQYAEVI